MNKWLELAAKCEAATGPNREIDWAIACFLGRGHLYQPDGWLGDNRDYCPRYTASVDVITALVERELRGHMWALWHNKDCARAAIDPGTPDGLYVMAETAPLALCVAFCRAMAAKSPEKTPESASADCK